MKWLHQVAHVFRKDVTRFWPGLAGVAAVGLFQRFFEVSPASAIGIPFAGVLPIFTFATIVLAASVVQADTASSQNAHWRTTPLHPGAVFAAKSAFLLLFLCLPAALAQLQLVASRAPVSDPAGILLDAVLFQGGLLAVAALGAAITPNLGAFLTLALAGWVGIEFYESSMLVRGGERWPGAGEMLTRAWVLHLGGLVIGAGLLLHQYVTRNLLRTTALGLAGLAGVLGGLALAEPDIASGPMVPETRHAYDEPIELRLSRLGRTTPATSGERLDWVVGTLTSSAQAVHLVPTRSTTRLVGPDFEETISFDDDNRWQAPWYDIGRAVPGMRRAGEDPDRTPQRNLVQIPLVRGTPEAVTDLRRVSHWETNVHLDAFELTVAARIPLEEGAVHSVPSGRLTVLSVGFGDGTLDVEVSIETSQRALQLTGSDVFGSPAGLVLHNPSRGEFLTTVGSGGGRSFERTRMLTSGPSFHSYRWTLSFGGRGTEGDALADDWFDDVELVALGTRYLGSLEQTIKLDTGQWPEPNDFIDFDRAGGR